MAETASPPLGIFDSGLGGLTVAREILRLSPVERLIYIGDTAHVPYGPRSVAEVQRFSVEIARYLADRRGCRAVVIACNTATSAAAEAVRAAVSVPVVAMEPGVKPAVAATRSGVIGVLATVGTLTGDRFATLVKEYARNVRVLTQPCPGWVEAVEAGDFDSDATRTLIREYVTPLIAKGADTLSLGCTHYPLLRPLITEAAGPDVAILDTGEAVARRVLSVAPASAASPTGNHAPRIELLCTGDPHRFGSVATAILTRCGLADRQTTFGHLTWKNGELHDDATN